MIYKLFKFRFLVMVFILLSIAALGNGSRAETGAPENAQKLDKPEKAPKKKNKFVNKRKKAKHLASRAPVSIQLPAPTGPLVKPRESLHAWLLKMKKNIARADAKHNQLVAVAAVRGAETPDSPPLYWKGPKSKGSVNRTEMMELDQALEAALNGDQNGAKSRLQTFVTSYPESALIGEANQTLKMLDNSAGQ